MVKTIILPNLRPFLPGIIRIAYMIYNWLNWHAIKFHNSVPKNNNFDYMYMPCQFQDDIFVAKWDMNTWIYKWIWEILFKLKPANWPSTLTIAHGQQTCRNHEKRTKTQTKTWKCFAKDFQILSSSEGFLSITQTDLTHPPSEISKDTHDRKKTLYPYTVHKSWIWLRYYKEWI